MKNFSYVDYQRGQLDNPEIFGLDLFPGLALTKKACDQLDLNYGDKVIIAIDDDGHYLMGKANSKLDPEAWPINWKNYLEGEATISLNGSQLGLRPFLDVKPTGNPLKGLDQNGKIHLYKITQA